MTTIDLLHALLRVNLAAGATILIVIALRKPARLIAGARQAYGLWLLPLLAVAAGLLPARQVIVTLPPLAPLAEASGLIATGGQAASLHHLDPSYLLLTLWLSGALLAVFVVIVLQVRFARAAARGVIGPAVVGVFRPRIITPPALDEIFDAKERTLVLAHEEAHIARQDSRINGLSVLFQCLFWFNPLVHLAAHLARIDQEMACDEAVIIRFPGARQTYARALVKAQLATRPLPLGCCWPSGTEHPLEERIAMLKTKTKSRPRRLAAGSALAALCAATGVAAWAAQPPSMAVVHAIATTATTPAPARRVAYRPAQTPSPTPAVKPVPAKSDAPAQVCITNACMPHADGDKVQSIADAIAKGDAAAVVAMGGSGKDAIAALLNGKLNDPPGRPGWASNNLQTMATMDNVTISNLDGTGKVTLVGTNDDGSRHMFLIFPELGPAPSSAPVFTSGLPPPPTDGSTLRIGPDGVQTIIPAKTP
jgi:beta-lactamase regulating signal transducer with metallopeptidase domain